MAGEVPTLFEWVGGMPALDRLFELFYQRVPQDPLLAPIFAGMGSEHPRHVARFVAEVLGGPKQYSAEHGGHVAMVRHHVGRAISEAARQRWIALLLACADELGVPGDPEFRSAFVGYLEWGSRLAVLNSRPGAPIAIDEHTPMPA